ncbi:Branched-chain alpha-keto acid dehydrogenase, E1 component, alpha subunit [Alkalibacterium sp. AK22]|uniref:thiamine pyrophosphate-dependent dehydrogenase E1 component subunit alpha n=1 Tax=Alkalibacterium sp. AK22 TaxID=1229520 RepID=UPI00044DF20D|nr:thiamine pyrophosphate-dependent dehydrogenase E1 component subunit alpha [Alkalibacterium sp. AK22]EXJ23234.1 Branched-chain alpha-keto acid dehydrogenase, E1 component, alpha subunit [Alkalibacterium sp. AK22]
MKKLEASGLTTEEIIQAYRTILLGRRLDERLWQLTRIGKTSFNISGQGHEVGQVAMAMAFQPEKDYFLPYYRDMSACLVWGMTPKDILLGSLGKEDDPSSHGRQMPNHYGSKEHNIVSHSSTVSTQFPLATGVAYGAQLKKADYVTLTATGEGAANQGEVQEAMNFAGVKKLPMVFVIENNGYAISVGVDEQYANEKMSDRGPAYGFPGIQVNGNDFAETYLAFKKAADNARSGKGPTLIELMVTRLTSHSADDDHSIYRTKEDLAGLREKDGLTLFEKQLIEEGYLSQEELKAIDSDLRKEIDQATEAAERMPDPTADSILDQVYAD